MGAAAPLTLPLQPAVACTLSHELQQQMTPRTRAYILLAETLAVVGGYVAAIMLEANDDGRPGVGASVCT